MTLNDCFMKWNHGIQYCKEPTCKCVRCHIPECISQSVLEVDIAIDINDHEVSTVEEEVAHLLDIVHQLDLSLFRGTAVAGEIVELIQLEQHQTSRA